MADVPRLPLYTRVHTTDPSAALLPAELGSSLVLLLAPVTFTPFHQLDWPNPLIPYWRHWAGTSRGLIPSTIPPPPPFIPGPTSLHLAMFMGI